jgi:hypothetical protein
MRVFLGGDGSPCNIDKYFAMFGVSIFKSNFFSLKNVVQLYKILYLEHTVIGTLESHGKEVERANHGNHIQFLM